MIKKHLKILIITSAVILLPILAGVILWGKLPSQLPIHWNINGEVDGWCGKAFGVFGIPLILAALHWVCVIVTLSDPKKKNHSEKIMFLVFWLVPVLSVFLCMVTYITAMGKQVQINVIIPIFLGFVFAAIGNYLPKCKQNYTMGIKLPWTLNSEENWNKTHRLAGWLWVIGGVIMMLIGFFGIIWINLVIASIIALIPIIYSYVLHLKGI